MKTPPAHLAVLTGTLLAIFSSFGALLGATPAVTAPQGEHPHAGLVLASNGYFYGVTSSGGTYGSGTIFKMSPAGVLTILYQCGSTPSDIQKPEFGLVQGRDGYLYGSATNSLSSSEGIPEIVFFKMSLSGTVTFLNTYIPGLTGGEVYPPSGPLVVGPDGNLYGETYGDSDANNPVGNYNGIAGRIFKLTPTGTLSFIAAFDNESGVDPEGGLILGSDGAFYGAALGSAIDEIEYPYSTLVFPGEIFRITPAGKVTALAMFYGTNGLAPIGPLVRDSTGNLYGVTSGNLEYTTSQSSTIFECSASRVVTTLHTFPKGVFTAAGLVADKAGRLYGVTPNGGVYGGYNPVVGEQPAGSIFKFSPTTMAFTTVFNLYPETGTSPETAPILDGNGDLFGTTLNLGSGRHNFTPGDIPPSNPTPTTANGGVYELNPSNELSTLATFFENSGN